MIGVNKKALDLSSKRERVTYRKFNVWDCGDREALVATESLNCHGLNGGLRMGLGTTYYTTKKGNRITLPSTSLQMSQVHLIKTRESEGVYKEKEMLLCSNGNVYIYNDDTATLNQRGTFGVKLNALNFPLENFDIATVFYGAGFNIHYEENGPGCSLFSDTVKAATVHKNRIFFALDKQYIYYTESGALRSFSPLVDDMGKIFLPSEKGPVVGLAALGEDLFVFYQKGITRLSETDAPIHFKVEILPCDKNSIFAGSVQSVGDKIYFLCEDGVCSFDGENIKTAYTGMQVMPRTSSQNCLSARYDNGWILSFYDSKSTKRTVVLDGDGKSGYYCTNFKNFSSIEGKTFCQDGVSLMTLSEGGSLSHTEKIYFSVKNFDLNCKGKKTIRRMRFSGSGTATITISANGSSDTYALSLYQGEVEILPQIRGEKFDFDIELSIYSSLNEMEIEYERR